MYGKRKAETESGNHNLVGYKDLGVSVQSVHNRSAVTTKRQDLTVISALRQRRNGARTQMSRETGRDLTQSFAQVHLNQHL